MIYLPLQQAQQTEWYRYGRATSARKWGLGNHGLGKIKEGLPLPSFGFVVPEFRLLLDWNDETGGVPSMFVGNGIGDPKV